MCKFILMEVVKEKLGIVFVSGVYDSIIGVWV